MAFPLGDWLLFYIGIVAFVEWRTLNCDPSLRILPFAWIVGWILENALILPQAWHWHFSRLFVLLCFSWIAWKRTPERKVFPMLMTGLTLLGQDLFLINEPGIFAYDQWVFAFLLMCIASFSAQSLWGMALGMSGGILLNLGFSVFLFDGIVRHYDLPDPFLWHFSITALVGLAVLKLVRNYYQVKQAKSRCPVPIINPRESMAKDINSLEEHESTLT